MPSQFQPMDANELEIAVAQAIAARGGELRSTIRGLIVAKNHFEIEVCDLMQAVSRAFVRRRRRVFP
jgi:hypothetical protein